MGRGRHGMMPPSWLEFAPWRPYVLKLWSLVHRRLAGWPYRFFRTFFIEISQAYSRTQAIEARAVDTRHVAGPAAQSTSNTTLLATLRRFGSRVLVKISKAHLRRYVATAWGMSIAIYLPSAMAAIGPLLWYTHATAARHENDSPPSH